MALSNRSNSLINSRRLAILLASTALAASPAAAATYNVTDEASLIAAINAANASAGSDTIVLSNAIMLSGALPTITDLTTFDTGAFALTGVSGNVVSFTGNGNVSLTSGGAISGGSGAIRVNGSGGFTVDNAAGGMISGTGQAIQSTGLGTTTINNGGDITNGIVSTGGGNLVIDNAASGNIVRIVFGSAIDLSNGGALTLTNAGDVVGSGWGIVGRNANDSVTNSGRIASGTISGNTITSGGNQAVLLASGGSATNLAGGQILGTTAVQTSGVTTVTNAGSITGGTGQFNRGVYFTTAGGTLDNQLGGTITGGRGVQATGTATITNAGTITSNCAAPSFQCTAIVLFNGGTITNAATGVITSSGRGIGGQGASTTTIINDGSIVSTLANDIAVILFGGGSITNNATGTIANANGYGAYIFSTAGSIANAGSITGQFGASIDSTSGTVTNSGTISGTNTGVSGFNATLGLTNSGQISGTQFGVRSTNGALTVTNLDGGTISSVSGIGISTDAGTLTVDNQAGASISAGSIAIRSAGAAMITNAGTISSTDADTLLSLSTLDLTNSGTITGGFAGISATAGGTIVNSGTINGSANASGYSYAVQLTGAGSISNLSGGTLGGADGAIALFGNSAIAVDLQAGSTANGAIVSTGDGARTLTVNGALTGNYTSAGIGVDTLTLGQAGSMVGASLGEGDDLFTSQGGTISGNIDGGIGSDLFTANVATGASGTVSLASVTAFETISKLGLGTFTLTGDSASPAATVLAGDGGNDDGVLVFDGTTGLNGDIYVNGAIIRANTAGAFGTGTIHTIDPTVQYAATGTYSNNILLSVAGDGSLDPTRLEALNSATATLTGSITQDPMVGDQYVTIGGDGAIVLTNTANLWAGTTAIDSGATLQGASDTISGGNIVDNGALNYVQVYSGTVAQDISGSGRVGVSGLGAGNILTFAGNLTNSGINLNDGSTIAIGGTANVTSGVAVLINGTGATVNVLDNASVSTTNTPAIFAPVNAATVNNLGAIASTNDIAVNLAGGGFINNGSATDSNASITGGFIGVASGNALLTVDNYGLIRGTSLDGINSPILNLTNRSTGQIIGDSAFGVRGTMVTIDNAGQIVGRFAGVQAGGTIDLTNSGLIGSGYLSGTTFSYSDGNDGVQALNGGTINNHAAGQILGSISGIYTTGAALSVTNAGLINGANANGNGGFGIYANGGGLTLNNLAGGTVNGATNGIADLTGNGLAITNAGTINGDTAIFNQTNGATINNLVGGQLSGVTQAIVSNTAFTLTNAGTVLGTNGSAVVSDGALTLNNSGTIDGGNSALFLNAGGTIINSGTIISRGVAGFNQDGISVFGTLNLTNSGSISAAVNAGVVAFDGPLTVNNQVGGTITGGNSVFGHAINAKAGLDLTNGGAIMAGSGTTTAVLVNGTSTINLLAGSTTNGNIVSTGSTTSALTVAGLLIGRYDATTGAGIDTIILTSTGTLGGALLGSANDSFTTRGGVINGAVNGGAGSDALTFDIAGTISYSAGLFNAFETRSKVGAGTLTLTGTDAMIADFAVNAGTLILSGGSALNDGAAWITAAGTTTRLANANEQVRTISGAGAIDLGAYALILGGNDTTNYAGVISGSGSLAKFGTGGLTLSGANTYTGLTQVSGGTLHLGANDVIANASIVSVASGATFDLAGFSDTIGGLTGAGTVALGAGRLTIDQATNTVFSGPIFGTGGITKLGLGLLNLTGVSTYTGTTLVNAGTLAVNGSLASAVTVNAGGTLAGSGSVNGLTINAGGILSPGGTVPVIVSSGIHTQLAPPPSYATFTVNGPLTFNAGSFYDVDIDPTQSDHTIVNGTTTLNGGTVRVNAANGTYNPLTIYTIIQSSVGVTGQFAGVTDNLAFLDTSLTYTANQVNLEARRNNIIFSAVAANPNQANVADALQSIRSGRLYDAVLVQTADGAQQAYDALSGEIHASTQTAIFGNRDRLQDAMASNRLRTDGMGLWIDAGRSWGTYDQSISRGYAIASSDTNDLLGGFNWTRGALGLTAAGGRVIDKLEVNERDSKAKAKSWLFGGRIAYGAQLGLQAVAGGNYASHKVSTDRSIIFPGFAETASSSRKGDGYHLFAQVGFASQMSGITLEPFVGLSRDRLKLDGLSENGGLAALDVRSASRSLTSAQVGLKLSAPANFGWGTLTPRTSIAWQHVMGDRNGQMDAGFQAGGLDYSITGAALARDAAKVGLDLALDFGGASVIAGYNGTIGGDASQHTAKLAFQLHF